MENFFFYNDNGKFNFESIFKYYYPNRNVMKNKLNKYINELNLFKEKYLLYFAFFKTCMEFSSFSKIFNSHQKIKVLVEESENIEKLIEKEISCLNIYIQRKFISKYKDNVDILNSSGYMLIRGHDVFDHLIDFLKKDGKYVKKMEILKLSSNMAMPDDFLNKISI